MHLYIVQETQATNANAPVGGGAGLTQQQALLTGAHVRRYGGKHLPLLGKPGLQRAVPSLLLPLPLLEIPDMPPKRERLFLVPGHRAVPR